MKATVTWIQDFRFIGIPPSGHAVVMDASPAAGGGNAAPRPLELLLLGLGGCTGMDVVSILVKMRKEVAALEIVLEAEQGREHPRKLDRVTMTYRLRGTGLDGESVRRAIELSQEKYCTVGATLKSQVAIDWRFEVLPEAEA